MAALIAAGLVIPYVWIGMGDKPFDDEARGRVPGQFAELTSGRLHYVWVEPAPEAVNGETVVMLHGLYVPILCSRKTLRRLAQRAIAVAYFEAAAPASRTA